MTPPRCLLPLLLLGMGGSLSALDATKPKPKFTIKQVMKEAIKGDTALVKKACKGTATPEELKKMVAYFQALTEGVPPRGDADSWSQKSTALFEAAVAIEKDPQNKEASLRLEKAVECRQCHNAHKPAK